jgi:diaminopimelate epimerase
MLTLPFTKMHGLGNDFVVLDALRGPLPPLTPERIRRLADRHFGAGCDQVLLVAPPDTAGADFRYRIFNHDGGEVEQCGNGARCFARYVRARGYTGKHDITVDTAAGRIHLQVLPDERVRVDMGAPRFEPADIPFDAPARAPQYPLEVGGEILWISALSMGNPHAVLRVDDVAAAPVARLGPLIEQHPRFPRRVNAGFMQVLAPQTIRLRVHERGAGETLACGTGACAAAVAGMQHGLLDGQVTVLLPGGTLDIAWAGEGQPVLMTGAAEFVFTGEIDIPS